MNWSSPIGNQYNRSMAKSIFNRTWLYIIYIIYINWAHCCWRCLEVRWGSEPTTHTETLRNQDQTRTWTQGGGPPGWMWSRRCGCVSVCVRTLLHLGTLCRRTESQQAGPDTLLLWWSQRGGGGGGVLDYRCTRQCNHHHTIKTPGLVVPSKPAVTTPSSPCDSSVCHSYSNISSPLHLPVAAASQTLSTQHLDPGSQISLGGQDETDPLQPTSPPWGPQTERVLCGLCLGPVWVHRHLTGEQDMIRGWRSGPGFPVRSGAPA